MVPGMIISKSAPVKLAPPVLTGQAKLAEVTHLMDKLNTDLQNICMLPHQRDAALEQLKIYGRDPKDADPIFAKKGIETLTRHAFNSPSFTTSRNALRCLADAMLLNPSSRTWFVELHYETKLCQRLKNGNCEDELLVSRIIFLTTYSGNVDIEDLIDNHQLADNINHNIARHAKQYDEVQKIEKIERRESHRSPSSMKEKEKPKARAKRNSKLQFSQPCPMEDMSLVETLKLLFNLTHLCPQRSWAFSPAIPYILRLILGRHVLPDQPMEPPMPQLVNSLINLELEPNASAFFPRSDPKTYVERMIALLDLTTTAYTGRDLEKQVPAILSLMRKLYNLAPRPVKIHMRALLPTADDRAQPLESTDTLSSRILRLSTSSVASTLRKELSCLLLEMSDRDAENFMEKVSYAFASGFESVPGNVMED